MPTDRHEEVALPLLARGCHLLIEKPLCASLEEAERVVVAARAKGCLVQVGHVEHFNPVMAFLEKEASRPQYITAERLAPYQVRGTEVGVVLDLMIHDLDVVLSFVNSPVKEIRAVGLPILSSKVDIANVRMEFESGCVANFTASRVSTERVRKLRLFQPKQYISLDYSRQDVVIFTVGEESEAAGTPSVNPQIKVSKPPIVAEEPLHAELKSFLHAVRTRSKPLVAFEDGRRALEVALDVVATIGEHGARVDLDSLRTSG